MVKQKEVLMVTDWENSETEKGFIMAKQRRNVLACNSEVVMVTATRGSA